MSLLLVIAKMSPRICGAASSSTDLLYCLMQVYRVIVDIIKEIGMYYIFINFHFVIISALTWLGDRKDIHPVKIST